MPKNKTGGIKKAAKALKGRAAQLEKAEAAAMKSKSKPKATPKAKKKDPYKSDMDRLRGIKK